MLQSKRGAVLQAGFRIRIRVFWSDPVFEMESNPDPVSKLWSDLVFQTCSDLLGLESILYKTFRSVFIYQIDPDVLVESGFQKLGWIRIRVKPG